MSSVDEAEYRIYELVAKANYENGRERNPKKRTPKKSTKWVDWY